MRKVILSIMVFALVFVFCGISAANSETPKETKADKKVEAMPNVKTATTKTSKGASVIDAKCVKCHKGDKDVKKIVEAKGIKSSEEMVKLIRQGAKAELHKKISDKDLKASGKELFGEKKTVDSKKKNDVKTETKKTEDVKTETEKVQEKPKKKKPEGC